MATEAFGFQIGVRYFLVFWDLGKKIFPIRLEAYVFGEVYISWLLFNSNVFG